MDAFEIRMQFLAHLRRLTSAAQSINKVVAFLLKHSSQAPSTSRLGTTTVTASHEESDLWECIMEELEKSTINARMNIFYMLDSLMNIFYMLDSLMDQSLALGFGGYRELVRNDLEKVVDFTVPLDKREGILNRMSTLQVLNSWKMRRILPVTQLDALISQLQASTFPNATSDGSQQSQSFSRSDILRRIEDDRERHKRLRERIWVLPVPSLYELSSNPKLATVLTCTTPADSSGQPKLVSLAQPLQKTLSDQDEGSSETAREAALDIEFEQAWEALGDQVQLEETDLAAMMAENERCFA